VQRDRVVAQVCEKRWTCLSHGDNIVIFSIDDERGPTLGIQAVDNGPAIAQEFQRLVRIA